MADPTPSPAPTPAPDPGWFARNAKWLIYGFMCAGWAVSAILALRSGGTLPPPPPLPQQPQPVQGEMWAPVMGWHRDEAAIAENLDPAKTLHFSATPAGRAVMAADTDVFLWRAVRKANGKDPADSWYPNINQGRVGDCVGAGSKHATDCLEGVQIASGGNFAWKPVSLEVIYAGSRVEVGGGRLGWGDGSVGAWAAKWLQNWGFVPMEKVGNYDLSSYSESRARQWGRSGVPDDLEPIAREHPIKGIALVRSFADVDRAIRQGYPCIVCSDQGFSMTRDGDGFCSPSGSWAHCMAILGVRGGARPGAFILNSWGNSAHTGPTFPADAPVAGFWADARTVDRMTAQGDSWAFSDAVGFPGRKLPDNWFIRAKPRRQLDLFASSNWSLVP